MSCISIERSMSARQPPYSFTMLITSVCLFFHTYCSCLMGIMGLLPLYILKNISWITFWVPFQQNSTEMNGLQHCLGPWLLDLWKQIKTSKKKVLDSCLLKCQPLNSIRILYKLQLPAQHWQSLNIVMIHVFAIWMT